MKNKKGKKIVTIALISVMTLFSLSSQVFAAESDELINSEIFEKDNMYIQKDTFLDENGSVYSAHKVLTEVVNDNVLKVMHEEDANELRNANSMARDSSEFGSYQTRYFYDYEQAPRSEQVFSQIFGNWFQGYQGGLQVLGIEDGSQAVAGNSTYERIVMDEAIVFSGTNLSLSFSIPPGIGFEISREEDALTRHTSNSGYGDLIRYFDYPIHAKAGGLTFGYSAEYTSHVDGYISGNPHEAIASTSYKFTI